MKRSMEISQSAVVSPATLLLLCNENSCSFDDDLRDEDEDILADVLENENGELLADEYIELILEREMIVDRETEFSQDTSIQTARLEGILHILQIKDCLELGFQTVYVAVTYLHRFLSKTCAVFAEKPWTTRMVAMACLSLASKMEENGLPPPFIREESSVIQRTELLVLNTLEWRMVTVTPFAFMRFFARKFSLSANGLSTVADLILASARDEKIMSHRPSVIAAAANCAGSSRID